MKKRIDFFIWKIFKKFKFPPKPCYRFSQFLPFYHTFTLFYVFLVGSSVPYRLRVKWYWFPEKSIFSTNFPHSFPCYFSCPYHFLVLITSDNFAVSNRFICVCTSLHYYLPLFCLGIWKINKLAKKNRVKFRRVAVASRAFSNFAQRAPIELVLELIGFKLK